jgi:hypothetical protein
MPNKQDGDGYLTLLTHDDGSSHYGVFCALVLLASKCTPRGDLVQSNGIPHTVETIARKTHHKPSLVLATLQRCLQPDIDWIEWIDHPGDGPDLFSRPEVHRVMPQAHPAAGVAEKDTQVSAKCPSEGQPHTGPSARNGNGIGNGTAAEADPPAAAHSAAAAMVFPCRGDKAQWSLSEAYIVALQQQFPALDVRRECGDALAKVFAIPHLQKTADQMEPFLWNWMERSARERRAAPAATHGGGDRAAQMAQAIAKGAT